MAFAHSRGTSCDSFGGHNTDEELAKMIGYVRAVVNRHMQHFKKEGTIETHRNYLAVRDLHGLLNMVDEYPGLR